MAELSFSPLDFLSALNLKTSFDNQIGSLSETDGGVNPGPLTGPTCMEQGPAGLLGQGRDGPPTRAGELPSLLSQRVRETDLPGHVAAPRPGALGQNHAEEQGCALQECHVP